MKTISLGLSAFLLSAAALANTSVPDVSPVANGQHVVINIPQQRLFLYTDGKLTKIYPVAVGKAITQTNLGEHKIGGKAFNPTWHIPKSIQKERGDGVKTVPPGPKNPLGPVFVRMGDPKLGLGIHGTNNPASVPGVVSHGCVRMKPEQALEFAKKITTGSTALVSYELAALNVDDANNLWLAVFKDPYKRNSLNTNALKKTIQAWAKENGTTISAKTVDVIIKNRSGQANCLSCKLKGAKIRGDLKSLAWNQASLEFTSPKHGGSGNDYPNENQDEILPEGSEIEVDAEVAPSKKTTKANSKKAVPSANNAGEKKLTPLPAQLPQAASEPATTGERVLKPIKATSVFETLENAAASAPKVKIQK